MIQKNLDNLNQSFVLAHKTRVEVTHAFERKDFAFKIVNDKAMQIMSNIILIVNCRRETNPNYSQNKNHWKGELRALFDDISESKLKTNNTYKSRLKLIENILYDGHEILSETRIKGNISRLQYKEHCEIEYSEEFVNELAVVLSDLIHLSAKPDNKNAIHKYIDSL